MNALSRLLLTSCLCLPALAQEPPTPAPNPAPTPAPDSQQQEPKTDAPKKLQLGNRVDGKSMLSDIDGRPVRAQEFMGKITVVNFYSIQCPIQRAWDGRLAEIQKEFEGQGVVFLHIDSNVTEIGENPPAADAEPKPYTKIREHLLALNLPFRVLADHGNKMADFFEARTTPHVFVFGQDGKLVYKGLVDDDQKNRNVEKRTNYLRDTLGKLIKNEKVEPFSTKEEGCSIKRVKQAAPIDKEKGDKGKADKDKADKEQAEKAKGDKGGA